jgi:hypothetical protein
MFPTPAERAERPRFASALSARHAGRHPTRPALRSLRFRPRPPLPDVEGPLSRRERSSASGLGCAMSGPSLNPQSRSDSSNLRFSRGAEAPRRGPQDEQSRSPGAAPGLPDHASVRLSDHLCRKAPRNTDASSPRTSSSFFLVFRILLDLRYSAAAAMTGSLSGSVPCSASSASSTTSGLIRNHAA